MSLAPRQPAPAAGNLGLDGLIMLTERLTALLSAENQLLASRRPAELAGNQEEKHRLTALYAREMASFKSKAAEFKANQPGLVQRLQQATASFRQIMEEHTRRLTTMKTVTEGVIRSIGEEVAKRNSPIQGYGKDAVMQSVYGNRSTVRPTTLALNQVV